MLPPTVSALTHVADSYHLPVMISPPCCRQPLRPLRMLQCTRATIRAKRQSLRPFRLLPSTRHDRATMLPPIVAALPPVADSYHLPVMISPPCCRQSLRRFRVTPFETLRKAICNSGLDSQRLTSAKKLGTQHPGSTL
jgi:hypothetical protein